MCVVGVKKTFMRVLRFVGLEDFISMSGQKLSKHDQWLKLLFYNFSHRVFPLFL